MGTSDPALLTALMLARELSAETVKPELSTDANKDPKGPLS